MLALSVALLVVAADAPDVRPLRLAMSGLVGAGLEQGATTSLESRFAQSLRSNDGRLEVLLSRDISAVLGKERERQLLGCDDDSQCVAELAGALDVQGLLVGDVSLVGSTALFNIRVVDGSSARTMASRSVNASSLEQLLPLIDQVAVELRAELLARYRGVVLAPPVKPSALPWVLVGVGAASLVAGGVLVAAGNLRADELTKVVSAPPTQVRTELQGAATLVNVGIGLAIAGAALTATGVVLRVSQPAAPVLAFSASRDGAVVAISGAFP